MKLLLSPFNNSPLYNGLFDLIQGCDMLIWLSTRCSVACCLQLVTCSLELAACDLQLVTELAANIF